MLKQFLEKEVDKRNAFGFTMVKFEYTKSEISISTVGNSQMNHLK